MLVAVTLIAALLAPATLVRTQGQSTTEAKGDLDLERFDSAVAIRSEPDV